MTKFLITAVGVTCVSSVAFAQGFINMDFEAATVQPSRLGTNSLEWNLAAPGWGHSDGASTSFVYYQQPHLGEQQIYLLIDSTSPVFAPGTQLAGNYSLAFASGNLFEPTSPWINAYISQTGFIPSAAQSLQLLATGPFRVLVGGVEIPMVSLGGYGYGGDISQFAGSTYELTIMNTARAVQDYTVVDNIFFSPVAIPEPGTLALFAVGAVLTGALWLFRRRHGCPEV